MDVLTSNNTHAATSQKVKDILCMYCIISHTSEPHHQHQNYAKHCIRHIKDVTIVSSPLLMPPATFGYYVSCM